MLLVLYHGTCCMVCSVLNNHVVWNGKWNMVLYVKTLVLNLWRMLEGDEMEIVCWWWC